MVKLPDLRQQINDQRAWIKEHGTTLAAYVARYGSKDAEKHYGNGGEAIYAADVVALGTLEKLFLDRGRKYAVRGRWPFPLDMLRRDIAVAATMADQDLIDRMSGEESDDEFGTRTEVTINLMMVAGRRTRGHPEGHLQPNYERWESFGWKVGVIEDDEWRSLVASMESTDIAGGVESAVTSWQVLPRSTRLTTPYAESDVWSVASADGVRWRYTTLERAGGKYLASGEADTKDRAMRLCEAASRVV